MRVVLLAPLLALLLEIDYYGFCLEVEKSHWLAVSGFGLTSKVRIARQDLSKVDEEITVREYYSNVERRSNLQFTLLRRHKTTYAREEHEINYYYNGGAKTKQMLKTTATQDGQDCRPATDQMLAEDLFGSMSSIDGHLSGSDWLKGRDDVPDYFIGFARLLMIVDANRVRLEQTMGQGTKTRNQETVRYMLKDSLGAASDDEPSHLMVYYGKSEAGLNDLPLKIWFSMREDVEIIIDYSMVAQIDYEAAATKDIEGQNLFAFPLDSGCSNHLPFSQLAAQQSSPKLISFRASVENLVDDIVPELNYFVAYDGYAGAVRRDTIERGERGGSSYSITIDDLKQHLKYNIVRAAGGVPTVETGPQSAESRQCSVAQHVGQQLLLPLDGMVEMGRASVRGIEAVVFEIKTEQLPEILFPQISYTDSKGNTRSAYLPDPIGSEQVFCVNYYFSAWDQSGPENSSISSSLWSDGGSLGQLLRVDVMENNWPIYRVEVEEFIWELVDAPNGDRASELFALADRCNTGDEGELKPENYGTLKMELEFDAKGQKVSESASYALLLLESPIKRNRALLEALSQVEGLQVTQIRDLVSSVQLVAEDSIWQAGDSLRLRLEAKLDHHRHRIYKPVSVSKGRLRLLRGYGKPIRASNFEECFWEMTRKFTPSSSQMIFSFCESRCHVDERPVIGVADGQLRAVSSHMFELINDDSMPCEIFKMRTIPEETEPASRNLWSKISQSLREKDFRVPAAGQEKVEEPLILSPKSVELGNIRWSASDGNSMETNQSSSSMGESSLEGIGLRASSAGTTLVEAKEPGGYDEDKLLPPSMSYSVCRSSCLASLGCKSFSLCATSGRLECLLSELGFRDAELLEQIGQKSADLRAKGKRGSISVQVEASNQVDDQDQEDQFNRTTTSSNLIELRVDRRCHLYNKRALELFNPADNVVSIELRERDLVAAESEKQCAELCLARNLLFFKRSARIEALFLNEQDPDTGFLDKMRAKEARNLRSWCASFAYINLGAGMLPDVVKKTMDSSKLTGSGLCYFSKALSLSSMMKPNESPALSGERQHIEVPLHNYNFIYSSLYEPQRGLKLLAPFGNRKVTWSRLELDEVRKYAIEHNEQAFVQAPNLETCARLCFMQMTPVRPWCRSFGFVAKSDKTSMTPQFYCIFNSITAAAANRSPLRDQMVAMAPKSMSVVHYEPKDFMSLNNVYLIKQFELDHEQQEEGEPFRLKTFSISIIILFALISSSVFTFILGNRLVDRMLPRRESVENPSRSFLNSLIEGDSDVTHRNFEDDIALPDLVGIS